MSLGERGGFWRPVIKVCLNTTYELGISPFGIASLARWLEDAGAEVTCVNLAVACPPEPTVEQLTRV